MSINPLVNDLSIEQESKIFKIDDKNSVCIRRHNSSDTNKVFLTYNRNIKFLSKFILHNRTSYSMADSKFWINSCIDNWNANMSYEFLIIDENNGQILGSCSLNDINFTHRLANLGCWVLPNKLGKDLLDIAVAYMCYLGFYIMKLVRIEFVIDVNNAAHAKRIVRRGAGHFEGTLRNRLSVGEQVHDAHIYSVIPKDMWFYDGLLANYPKQKGL